jgi:hypothetical protein
MGGAAERLRGVRSSGRTDTALGPAHRSQAGTADRQIAFADQKQAIETARRANNATGKGETCGFHCTRYQSAGGAPVITLIHNEGHVYPDEVSPMIMEFFRKHPLTGAERY